MAKQKVGPMTMKTYQLIIILTRESCKKNLTKFDKIINAIFCQKIEDFDAFVYKMKTFVAISIAIELEVSIFKHL